MPNNVTSFLSSLCFYQVLVIMYSFCFQDFQRASLQYFESFFNAIFFIVLLRLFVDFI